MWALILLGLTLITSLPVSANPLFQDLDRKLSPSEAQEVDQFVRSFNRRLRDTRDLKPFLTVSPAREMLDRILLDKDDSLPLVDQNLISQRNLVDLRHFWIELVSLLYLSELYVYTKRDVSRIRIYELPREQQYPTFVGRSLKRNPILLNWWRDPDSTKAVARDVHQLRSITKTFQNAASLMRTYFKAHPPERTPRYQKNIAALSEYSKVLDVDTSADKELGSGLPLHTKTVSVSIPVLTLMLAWVDGQLRILLISIIDD